MRLRLLVIMTAGVVGLFTVRAQAQTYHTYPQIEAALLAAENNYPSICMRQNLGQTVQGRTMWALCISDNVGVDEDEPEFRFASSIHGDEVVGEELCLMLIDELTSNYGTDPRITSLVDSVEIWIMPCVNPDGFVSQTRYNAHGEDLNRSFPDPFTSPSNTTTGREPEVANIMNWCFGRSFTLAANYHCGELVVNYPFDSNASGAYVNSPTPDDAMFIFISETYSQYNTPLWNSSSYYHGITNGAAWYVIYGGLQDWSYRYMGTNEVTIEVSTSDRPSASQLPTFWQQNRESMLSYIETCLMGIRGIVTDANDAKPLAATMRIIDRDHDIFTDPDIGDYHRMVEPGAYDLRFTAEGYDPAIVRNVAVGAGDATVVDASLWQTLLESPNGGELLSPLDSVEVRWTGDPTAQFEVQATTNASAVGTWSDGFESGVLDAEYDTGGDANWYVATGLPHTGTRSARAGDVDDDETSWMTRSVSGGPLSFWYRVSSEDGYDFFRFYVDGASMFQASGSVGWTQFSTTLSDGMHELKWEYAKDYSVSNGSDTVWIDDISLTQVLTEWTTVVALTDPGATSADWTPMGAGDDCRVRVRSYRPAEGYGPWDESDASFVICLPGDLDGDFVLDTAMDTQAFVDALLSPPAVGTYAACAGDFDRDGTVNGLDIQAFVQALLAD